MQKNLLLKLSDYHDRKRRHRIWSKVVGALACVVVFITVYMLILPAVTMEKSTVCGIEEHTHIPECYRKVEAEDGRTLKCSLESINIHVHTEDCYGEDGGLVCGYADFVIHTHDANCYNADGNLACQLPETEEHQHTDACYEPVQAVADGVESTESGEKKLVCGKTQTERHIHTDACLGGTGMFICGKPEVQEHVHSEDCFQAESQGEELTCGFDEGEGHTHTELCYGKWELVCEMPEHQHTDACYETKTAEGQDCPEEDESEEQGSPAEEGNGEKDSLAEDENGEISSEGDLIMPLSVELPDEAIAGGNIEGTALSWSLTKSVSGEYTLTVSGEGAIPDYSQKGAPWYDYIGRDRQNLKIKLVLEEGITRIGNYAFYYSNLDHVDLPDTVTSIGASAFASSLLTEVDIPASVTRMESSCFASMSSLRSVTLHEGLEYIHRNAFISSGVQELNLPASLTTIDGGGLLNIAEKITVAEENEKFKVVDGVLFQLSADKTSWALLAFPANLPVKDYTVPDVIDGKPVTEISAFAFYYVKQLLNITIPESVKQIGSNAFQGSSVQKVTLESTTLQSSNGAFIYAVNLHEIEYSDLTGAIPGAFLSNATALTSLTIPAGITSIGNNAFISCYSLTEVVYDAKNATGSTVYPAMGTAGLPRYDLTIGPNVDVLSEDFRLIAERAETLHFTGPNQISIAVGALAGAPAPFSSLSGDIYVDDQGMIYIYDRTTAEASLFYCPAGITEAVVPAAISPEDGVTCTVSSVESNALQYTDTLNSIIFADPDCITRLNGYALANCPTLTSVNGKTSVEEAKASFPNAEVGYNVFYNTGLTDAENPGSFEENMDGRESLTVTKQGATQLDVTVSSGGSMTWIPGEDDPSVGGYRLLTGDTVTLHASVGNTEGDDNANVSYRLYLRLTDTEGSLSVAPGNVYKFSGQTVTCHATEDPYTVYLEFTPQTSTTMSFPVTAVYPSPNSSGGGLTVWGCILSQEEAAHTQNKLVEPEGETIQTYWVTQPDDFMVKKTNSGASAIGVRSDGDNGVQPNGNLGWQIILNRKTENTSNYGKDYVSSVDFTDTMTLPEGVTWKESVKEAIQSGNIRWDGNNLYAGSIRIATLSFVGNISNLYITDRQVTWDDALGAVLHWRIVSNTETEEMNASTVSLIIPPEALSIDMEVFSPTEKHTITNTADAKVHYHYREDDSLSSSAEKTITGGAGVIKLKKTAGKVQYFGEDVTYTLDAYNDGGLPWTAPVEGIYTLTDPLSQYVYISPENLQRMFDENGGNDLTVTIQNASLGTWQAVMGADGKDAWQHPGNTDQDSATGGHTLTITRTVAGSYAVEVKGGETCTADTVAEALQMAGYGVTAQAQYTCVWTLNGEEESCILQGGEHRIFQIYATVKDTFQMMSADWPVEYPSDSTLTAGNIAKIVRPVTGTEASNSANITVKREASIDKNVYQDGQLLSDVPTAADGDILEYRLDFSHYGSGTYQDLPMVDDLYGSQCLLVPVDLNPQLAEAGLAIRDEKYYILKEGTYQNVVVGVDDEDSPLIAASVTVQRAEEETKVNAGGLEYSYTGLHTQIKWYFPDIEGGNYRKTVTYQAVVDTGITGVSYTIGNIVWMNDREGSRIYDLTWGGGTIISFGKDIVTEKGTVPDRDVLDEDGYSLVEAGEKVTYRLRLENTGDGYFCLKGTDMADALPLTYRTFDWEKDVNVTDFRVEIVGENVEAAGLEDWTLGNRYMALLGERQYILWPGDTSVTFNGPGAVYLYFTLTYPRDTESRDTWSQYAKALGGGMLDNTMYVYRFPSTVTHDLKESGQALLQKGVYGMYYYNGANYYTYIETGNSRLFYNNRDSKSRAVAYYVTLFNGGSKRLYLDDLYDQLPAGFTYRQLLQNGNFTAIPSKQMNTVVTVGGTEQGAYPLTNFGSQSVIYRSATITATRTGDGVQFSVGAGTGDYGIRYDEERQQYYLEQGEAVVFGYLCDIGLAASTENQAVNVIAMPYTDQPETGIVVIDKNSMPVTAADSEKFPDYNDGRRTIKNGDQVLEDYGFGDGGSQIWLVSDVAVQRGGIIPGITKYADSYTNSSGVTEPCTEAISPFDIVNWRVRLHNSGTLSVTDYTLTDIMPAPYVIEGPVTLTIYDEQDTEMFKQTVCTFPTERTGGEDSLNVIRAYNSSGTINVPFNGTEKPVWAGGCYLSLSRDTDGNEIMQIHLQLNTLAIPEGGYVDLCFASRNPTNIYNNTVYTNEALLTPNVQEFTNAQQGSIVRGEDGNPVSVENSAPVTVSFGYDTSSEKRVAEAGNETNTADSADPEHNRILLSGADREFIYTLIVNNTTDKAMTKLVLIDNLPEPEDHSPFHRGALRGSEFTVSLAEDPRFSVTVTPKEGDSYQLDTGYYRIQYTAGTYFGGPGSADWNGADTGTSAVWTDKPEGARAFRVVISDDSATQIPPDATISVAFYAKAEGDIAAGGTAWNSFGYHYALKDVLAELESMPMPVGVQVPGIPVLEKQLVDSGGLPVNAPEKTEFSFLIYEGEALNASYDSTEALCAALDAAGRRHHQLDVTVDAGKNTSGPVLLDEKDWIWQQGQRYTVVELPADECYVFHSFYGSGDASYTFTYNNAAKLTILCKNTFQQWKISLTKVDDDREPLAGAVFVLYSPEERDRQAVLEEYSDLAIEETVEEAGQTWYLTRVAVSDDSGELNLEELLREKYYLLEVKAPDGYYLGTPAGQILYQSGTTHGVYILTVMNHAGYELPDSGGTGVVKIYMGGLLAVMLAYALLYRKNKCRREDKASS